MAARAPTDPQPVPALLERLALDRYSAPVAEPSSSTSSLPSLLLLLLLSHSAYLEDFLDFLLDPFLEDLPVLPFTEPILPFVHVGVEEGRVDGMSEGMAEGKSDGMDDVEGARLIDGWEEGAPLRDGILEGMSEG